jgi:hypothetical protein
VTEVAGRSVVDSEDDVPSSKRATFGDSPDEHTPWVAEPWNELCDVRRQIKRYDV